MDEVRAKRNALLRELASIGKMHPRALPLDRAAALTAAHEQPWLDPDDLVARIDGLATDLHIPEEASTIEAVARLNLHFCNKLGFSGATEDYDAPIHSMLDRVIEGRKGLPILLSLLYIEVARRVGVSLEGVGFPGHFVVRAEDEDQAFFIDPFAGGKVWRAEEMLLRLSKVLDRPLHDIEDAEARLQPSSRLEIAARLSRNLKVSYLRRADAAGALRAVDRLLALRPDDAEERRDRGLLLLELDRHTEALSDLQRYLSEHPGGEDWNMINQLASQLDTSN